MKKHHQSNHLLWMFQFWYIFCFFLMWMRIELIRRLIAIHTFLMFQSWCWERQKRKEERAAEDEMVRQQHWLNGHELEQTPVDSAPLVRLLCIWEFRLQVETSLPVLQNVLNECHQRGLITEMFSLKNVISSIRL